MEGGLFWNFHNKHSFYTFNLQQNLLKMMPGSGGFIGSYNQDVLSAEVRKDMLLLGILATFKF